MSEVDRQSMTYAAVMVPMDLDPASQARTKLAVDLAKRFSSRVIGVAAQPVQAPMYFEAPVDGVASIVEIEERRANEDLSKAEVLFRRIAGASNQVEWRQALKFPLDHLLEQSRAADLIVASRPRHAAEAFGPMTFDGGDLVMDAGRPILFVPPACDLLSAKRIVVGWKDTRESRRAVWDALPLLHKAEEVTVVSVGTKGNGARDVAAYLAHHGVNASPLDRSVPVASVADELIQIAERELSDLVVCGAYGHSRTREWVFGGVTRDLLDHSPVCCLMTH